MIDLEAIHLALRAKLLTIAELPTLKAWESVRFTPSATDASIEDGITGTKSRQLSATAAGGILEVTGLYAIKVYSIALRGDGEIRTIVNAILATMCLGASTKLANGDTLRLEGDTGIDVSGIVPIGANKVQCTITIPWFAFSYNPAVLSLTA